MSDGVLPPLYERWISAILGRPVPAEPRSTCAHCAMASWPGEPPVDRPFLADAKCCTYQPDLPNFNVGRLLADPDPAGDESRRVIRGRLKARYAVSPLGVAKAPVYGHLYQAMVSEGASAFGRTVGLRCPHYVDRDGGLCGVWRHRESVCATYFCRFERGPLGALFWRVVHAALRAMEVSVSLWAAREAGLDADAFGEVWARGEVWRAGSPPLDVNVLNNTVDDTTYRAIWGSHAGREAEFFRRCGEVVAPLELDDVMRIGGAVTAGAREALALLDRRLSDARIPERLAPGGEVLVQLRRPGQLRVRHPQAATDWLDLPEDVMRELHRFEDGPALEVLAALELAGVPIDAALVRTLIDWRVLVG